MDESYLLSTVQYIEINPVRAKLVREPGAYPWISAASRLEGRKNRLVTASPLPKIVGEWREFLSSGIRLESGDFITRLERELSRLLRR